MIKVAIIRDKFITSIESKFKSLIIFNALYYF